MTDREMLEFAAKAAGITLRGWSDYFQGYNSDHDAYHDAAWNPLTDDGDAFRLAVKLRMEIDVHHTGIAVRTPYGNKLLVSAEDEQDACAATRRAITRAAAEIGKAMP